MVNKLGYSLSDYVTRFLEIQLIKRGDIEPVVKFELELLKKNKDT